MRYIEGSVKDFIEDLSSGRSVPGGGSVIALTILQGLSLILMVGRISLRKKEFGSQKDLEDVIEEGELLKGLILEKVDEDVEIFGGVLKSRGREGFKEELRRSAIFSYMYLEDGLKVLKMGKKVSEVSRNEGVLSDLAIGMILADSGMESALFNMRANLKMLDGGMGRGMEDGTEDGMGGLRKTWELLEERKKIKEEVLGVLNEYFGILDYFR